MNVTDRASVKQVLDAINATGIKAPKILAAHEQAQKLTTGARNLAAPVDALAVAVAAAIKDDRDPAADPEVTRVLTAQGIANTGVTQNIDALAYDELRGACVEHGHALIEAWAVPFDNARDTLTQAHSKIGDLPLEDAPTILRKGGDIADVWSEAQAAAKTIETVMHGWIGLVSFTRMVSLDPRYVALRLADVDYPTWTAQRLERRKVTPWEATIAGLNLSLSDAAEYKRRVQVIEDGKARARQKAADDNKAALVGRRVA